MAFHSLDYDGLLRIVVVNSALTEPCVSVISSFDLDGVNRLRSTTALRELGFRNCDNLAHVSRRNSINVSFKRSALGHLGATEQRGSDC
jgi:hypothetical protein